MLSLLFSLLQGAPFFTVTLLAFFSAFLHVSDAATADEWRSRSIYQIVTDRFAHANDSVILPCQVELGFYCGGTWSGIRDKLDYIQGMGFDALWISPIVGQLPQQTGDGQSYTAYWQQNLYALNSKFGTEEDLHELISELHARGMLLMLDIVVNHMGYAGSPQLIDYTVLYPFNHAKYYHDYCSVDDPKNHTNAQKCWLGDHMVPLVDLKTEDPEVQNMFGEWIHEMVSNYSIDGLRIDTSINVEPEFFPAFVKASGVFATGEVMMGDDSVACEWENTIGSILNYPVYYSLIHAFEDTDGSMGDLVETMESTRKNCKDSTLLGSFSENHDVPRFAQYTDDMSLAKNVIAFTMLADGIPIIYQGQEQHMDGGISPYRNRSPLWSTGYNTSAPLYGFVATMNAIRHHVIQTSHNYTTYNNYAIYQDYHTIAMRKGYDGSQVITVVTNNGEGCDDYIIDIDDHGFPAGTSLTEITTCTNLNVNGTGYINLPMGAGEPKVLYPTHLMFGSKLCNFPADAPEGILQPARTTIASAWQTTISGTPTVYQTATVSPLASQTTQAAAPADGYIGGPHGSAHPAKPSHSHKALGGSSSVVPDLPLLVSAAIAATAVGDGLTGFATAVATRGAWAHHAPPWAS